MLTRILNRLTGSVIFECECDLETTGLRLGFAVKAAYQVGADLRYADLRDADLRGADLRGADLRYADLRDADLRGADLRDADLCGADLRGADLCGDDLRDADLRDAVLRDADLRGADLCGADLCGADLTPIRDDIWSVLSAAPREVPSLRQALIDGKVDGSTYQGDCCCLVGTIANARHCRYDAIEQLRPNSSRPAERFFLGIKKGDTPETSQFSRLALEWIDQWLANVRGLIEA